MTTRKDEVTQEEIDARYYGDFVSPYRRETWLGDPSVAMQIRNALNNQTLSHGWILSGPRGIGKATLAGMIARAKLAPSALLDDTTLATDPASTPVRQITNLTHPDFFLVRREWDEKKGRLETEIPVDRIRQMTQSLNYTATGEHGRVAIIDTADEMNNNAANALLKILEEPPQHALIILLANAPGRLLATIRSRCRHMHLRQVADDRMKAFLSAETNASDTEIGTVLDAAEGRPGYGLRLLQEGGAQAISSAQSFIDNAIAQRDVGALAAGFTGKDSEERWTVFRNQIFLLLSKSAKSVALGQMKSDHAPAAYLAAYEVLTDLCNRGERLNLDRGSLIEAMAYQLGTTLRNHSNH